MRTIADRVMARVVIGVCTTPVAALVGCAGAGEPGNTPVGEATVAPDPAAPKATVKPGPMLPRLTQEGLTFGFDSISATAQLYANNRKGRPQVRRDISLNGTIKDNAGRRLFRVAEVQLDALTDEDGHDLLAGAEIEENPNEYQDPWENIRINRNPGSPTSQAFSFRAGDLDELPARLGSVRGHVDVNLVVDMKAVEIVPEESDAFATPAPGISYRVVRWAREQDRLRFLIEYTLERGGEAGPDTPVFMGLDIRDDSGNPVHLGVRPTETVLGRTVQGILQAEVGINRSRNGPVKLLFATAMKPVRFEFNLQDIPLAEGRRRP